MLGAGRVGIASNLPEVVCAGNYCNRWKMMMLSVVLSIGLRLTSDTEISIRGENTNLTNMTKKRAKGRVRYSKSKPDDFYVQYEHRGGGSGLIGFLRS